MISQPLLSKCLLALGLHCLLWLAWPLQAATSPNIVLVFIDDMGWGDFSCFGNQDASTPHVDQMAAEGIRFEQFYVNSPICSPSRTAISTGQYPQRWQITSYLAHRAMNQKRGMAQWLDPAAPMLARFFQQAGYRTGHFGKWHMGGQRDVDDAPPITAYGFDTSLTNFEGMGPKLLPLTLKPAQETPGKIWAEAERLGNGHRWMLRSEITSGFVGEAIEFIEHARKEQKPFYINVWPDDVHSPFWPPTHRWAETKRAKYLSVLEEMDRQLGRLFDHLRSDVELSNNTLVLICSDNGPEQGAGSAGPFRGYKTHLYEGGIRSSLIAWGPSWISHSGSVDRESFFSAIDLVPTLLDFTGLQPPVTTKFDGEIMTQALLGKMSQSRSKPLFFRRPPDRNQFYGVTDLPDLAMRSDHWKLLCEYDGSQVELYDLQTDPSETNNLAASKKEIVATLLPKLLQWHLEMPPDNGAQLE